ncbi:Aste57867_11073 [Aphanomyces stellatus]|uniref:Aste57867_11073 protein n=1 Tax=Aphanomyces stellatus TaxID=120398 RepID=A0A485KT57_9STRA|nr:hypothetical protein As57867_011031 [Aphanomyces stellatus]VFT87940.1 Aste57867_11073 [Aphanomyces stellatus]
MIAVAAVASLAVVLALIYVRRRSSLRRQQSSNNTDATPDAPVTREFSRESEFFTPTKPGGRRHSADFQIHAVPSPPTMGQSVDLWDDLENLHVNSLHHKDSSDARPRH